MDPNSESNPKVNFVTQISSWILTQFTRHKGEFHAYILISFDSKKDLIFTEQLTNIIFMVEYK